MIFDELTLQQALLILADGATDDIKTNALFYKGDHWQNADQYRGPRPSGLDGDSAFTMTEIERGFVSRNVIAEVADRHANGAMARTFWRVDDGAPKPKPPTDPLAPPPEPAEPAPLVKEAADLLTDWIKRRKAGKLMRNAVTTTLYAGRGALRLFVPPAQLNADGAIPVASVEESIDRIYLMHPSYAQACVHVDDDTQALLGIYGYKREQNAEGYAHAADDYAEMTYLNEFGETIIRIVGKKAGEEVDEFFAFPLGKRLILHEMERPLMITEPVRSQQRLLNLAVTMMQRNVEIGGYVAQTLLNAQLPGKFKQVDGVRTFVPDPIYAGAGVISNFVGVQTTDKDGNKTLATPSVVYRDPVPVGTFIDTERSAYSAILAECHQLHYAMAGDAVASGESRITSMADYIVDLMTTKAEVDLAWSWLLETVLAMTAVFSGQPDRYAGLKIHSDCHIYAGPISPDMLRAVAELVDKHLLSRETGMARTGVDDVEAEKRKIQEENPAGINVETIARMLGENGPNGANNDAGRTSEAGANQPNRSQADNRAV